MHTDSKWVKCSIVVTSKDNLPLQQSQSGTLDIQGHAPRVQTDVDTCGKTSWLALPSLVENKNTGVGAKL